MIAAGYTVEAFRQSRGTAFDLTRPGSDDDLRRYLPLAWTLGSASDAEFRDSERMRLIRPWTAFGVEEALAKALEIGTRRYRERGVAALVGRLETQRAAALVADFEDPEARNLAFSELTKKYLADGLVAVADAAAERTADGDARATALSGVAIAYVAAGDPARAQGLSRSALQELGEEGGCEGDCAIVAAAGQSPPPRRQSRPRWSSGSSPSHISPVSARHWTPGRAQELT